MQIESFHEESITKNSRMKILLVSNQGPNEKGVGNPIMFRMKEALSRDQRIEKVDFHRIDNTIKSYISVRNMSDAYDIIHIHFGGLYALIIWILLLGKSVKKFITFHGTDIHAKALKTTKSKKEKIKIKLNQKASFWSIKLFDMCGFVASDMIDYVPRKYSSYLKSKSFIQRLGVDYQKFTVVDKKTAQNHLNLNPGNYILFSDVSNTPIKRRDIAEAIVSKLGGEYELLIMCGVKPDEVPYFINACDFVLLTSDEEGSPNIIREALALNKPLFSVNVGDAEKQLLGLNNSCIISRDPDVATKQILEKLQIPYCDDTRNKLKNTLDFVEVTSSIIDIYKQKIAQ
ncbi:MAG: hypothetical protein NC082_07690 [Clostridiales bacterium]|nr:hypothetical protein [Clostridiales bacterium]